MCEGPEEVATVLCDALNNISSNCPAQIKECFLPEDVHQMKTLHLLEMKDFLLRLLRVSGGQVTFKSKLLPLLLKVTHCFYSVAHFHCNGSITGTVTDI
jgi:hypothetical protein